MTDFRITSTAVCGAAIMFERFAYYGVRTLYIIFLMNNLGMPEQEVFWAYGLLTKAAYLTPLFIGPLIDLFKGYKQSIWIGGFAMAIGAALIAQGHLSFFIAGSCMLILGTSLCRIGIYSSVARAFAVTDNTRDIAFGGMYVAVNIGALLATTMVAFIGESFGYEYGFYLAGFGGVMAAVIILVAGSVVKFAPIKNYSVSSESKTMPGVLDSLPEEQKQVQNMPGKEGYFAPLSVFFVFLFVIIYWTLYELSASSMYSMGTEIPAMESLGSWSQMINPILLLVFIPAFMVVLHQVNKRTMKFHYIWMMVAAGSLGLIASVIALFASSQSLALFILYTLVITLSEVVYFTVTMSHVSRLFNQRIVATGMGAYSAVYAIMGSITTGAFFLGQSTGAIVLIVLLVLMLIGLMLFKLLGLKTETF